MAEKPDIVISESEQANIALVQTLADHGHLLATTLGEPAPPKDITMNGGIIPKTRQECEALGFVPCAEDTVKGVDFSMSRRHTMPLISEISPSVTLRDKPAQVSWNAAIDELGASPTLDKFIAAYPELRDITKVKEEEWTRASRNRNNPMALDSPQLERQEFVRMVGELALLARGVSNRTEDMTEAQRKFLSRVDQHFSAVRTAAYQRGY